MTRAVAPFPEELDRSLLHVLVFGADVGEAIAVALPGKGWVLVDGCRLYVGDDETFPALEAYSNLRTGANDAIELLVWTHPHADHYLGIREAIERYRPRRVGMTLVETPPPGSPAAELQALGTHPAVRADLRLQDVFRLVRSTLERVGLYWQEAPGSRVLMSAQLPTLTLGDVRLRTLGPNEEAIRKFYAQPTPRLRTALKARANELSVVLLVEYGKTRIVLGGDLPYRSNRGTVLEHGWKAIEKGASDAASHDGFKVSHHGSEAAIPPFFVGRADPPREWLVTPFATQHLPRPDGGLRELLGRVPGIRLTSTVGLLSPPSGGAQVVRTDLHRALKRVQARGFGRGLAAPKALTPFDFSWGVGFDANQGIRSLFAGSQAVTVVERATARDSD